MKNTLKTILISLAVVLVAASGVLAFLSIQQNTTAFDKIGSSIQNLRSLDQEWNVETMNVKSDPQADFDSLASFLPRLESMQSQLLSTANKSADIPDSLVNQLRSYSSELDSKAERLERFKTAYAVLRNSERFLPLAAKQAGMAARERGEPETALKLEQLEAAIGDYVSSPEEAKLNALGVEIKQFENRLSTSAVGLQPAEITFLSHAKVILDKKITTEKYYSDAVSTDTITMASSLVKDVDEIRSVRVEKKGGYIRALLGSLGMLVLTALTFLFVRGRKRGTPQVAEVPAGHDLDISDFDITDDSVGGAELFASQDRGANESNALVKALADIASNEMESASMVINTNLQHILNVRNELTRMLEETKSRVLNKSGEWTPSEVNFLISDLTTQSRLDSLPQFLSEIDEQSANIAVTAETLSVYAHKDIKTDYKMVDIRQCIDHMIEATGVDKVANISRNFAEVPGLFASEADILIIFRSVFQYVIESIGKAGHGNGILKINVAEADGALSITILDNGKGMDTDTRQKVLSFFLKENGGMSGIGIGMKLIRLFSTKYQGRVVINSDESKGTVMRLTFPIANVDAGTANQATGAAEENDAAQATPLTEVVDQDQTAVAAEDRSATDFAELEESIEMVDQSNPTEVQSKPEAA